MAVDSPDQTLEEVIARLAAEDDAEARAQMLAAAARTVDVRLLAERLKDEADAARYKDSALSLRWSDDAVALGALTGQSSAVALGRMAAGLTLYERGRYQDSAASFDEAAALFIAQGDDAGWARTQIGRTLACMALERFEEALERAAEARVILERVNDCLRVAALDNNLALLLERMNRPAEALSHSMSVLAAYRAGGSPYYTMHALGNHALLLWRLGRVREALAAHHEAREGYAALGALADAAREDLNIGAASLTLGHYAEAMRLLTQARRALRAADSPFLAAQAGLSLAECYVRLRHFREAIDVAGPLCAEFAAFDATLSTVQAHTLEGLAHAGLGRHEQALCSFDQADGLLARHESLAASRVLLDISRAQVLVELGRASEARILLDAAIPALREAGLSVEAASAGALRGLLDVDERRMDAARDAAREMLRIAQSEGLDWLAARALHLRGRVEMREEDDDAARESLAAAARCLDRVHRRVAWDHRAAFSGDTAAVYADAVALALRQQRPAVALRYAERAKARALTEHLRAGIDMRPRARDGHSSALLDELAALRDRYAWLHAARGEPALRLATAHVPARGDQDAQTRHEAAHLERRMVDIWRELQAANPAYRGEAAALDLADGDDDDPDDAAAARRWTARVQAALDLRDATVGPHDATPDLHDATLGPHDTAPGVDGDAALRCDGGDAALLEYFALGDDLVCFVLRGGAVRAMLLEGAYARLSPLVRLLRLNVERGAACSANPGAMHALAANGRGLLQRLHALLVAPATPFLDGASRVVIAPHGVTHHIPFHALHDGRRYLIEDMEVSYTPCAGLLEHFAERRRHLAPHAASPEERAAVGGVPPPSRRAGQRGRQYPAPGEAPIPSRAGAGKGRATLLATEPGVRAALVLACSNGGALPHVAEEGQAVVKALGGTLLCEAQAALGALRALAGECAVLHLAAHARFRPDEPLLSALRLYDGQLSTLDVFELDLRCSLATLSACETALGVAGAGDELMGLSRAFLYAGAPSLLLSLWKVEDRSTAALMGSFYRTLRAGATKAAALRRAQLALLHDEDGAGRHAPYFWAPFQLIGHPGPL